MLELMTKQEKKYRYNCKTIDSTTVEYLSKLLDPRQNSKTELCRRIFQCEKV